MTTAQFAFPTLVEGASSNIIQHNENLAVLDALMRNHIVDADNSGTPPVSPAEGEVYFVEGTGTGAWAGENNRLAFYIGGGWVFRDCPDGLVIYIGVGPSTDNRMYRKNGTGSLWTLLTL